MCVAISKTCRRALRRSSAPTTARPPAHSWAVRSSSGLTAVDGNDLSPMIEASRYSGSITWTRATHPGLGLGETYRRARGVARRPPSLKIR
jgi:hypothetical protein